MRTWEEELADRIDSLKNWLVLLGIVSVAALGVAIYALVEANDEQSGSNSGARSSQVRDLQQRVDDLEENSASDNSISEIKSDISDLDNEVQKLQTGQSDGVSSQDLTSLQQQVDDLSQQVEDLQNQPAP